MIDVVQDAPKNCGFLTAITLTTVIWMSFH